MESLDPAFPLHHNKQYEEECADILNEEWPRSKGARLHMLQKSNDNFPYSMVFKKSNSEEVIGHSRLCKVLNDEEACFLESVLICKKWRGKGLGRMLMKETEEKAKRLGVKKIYLTTHDKQDFYEHVGYTFSQPILSLGSASKLLSNDKFNNLLQSSTVQEDTEKREISRSNDKGCSAIRSPSSPLVPPPPPPPSKIKNACDNSNSQQNNHPPVKHKQYWMRKDLI